MSHDPTEDDWTQRLKESPSNPLADYARQVHEEWLTELEGLAVEAILTNNWNAFYSHVVGFQNENDLHGESLIAIGQDVSADELEAPSADLLPTTNQIND